MADEMEATNQPAAQRTRLFVDPATKPVLPRHIKLRHDKGRDVWLVLAPERVFKPDDIAVEVLKLCDGDRSVSDIAAILGKEYQAPVDEITKDIQSMLQELSDKGVVTA